MYDAPEWGGWRRLGDWSFWRGCFDLPHVLFEDVFEAFEVVEAFGAEMVWHATFDLVS